MQTIVSPHYARFHKTLLKLDTLVRNRKVPERGCGICENLHVINERADFDSIVHELSYGWIEFSGYGHFPVPSPDGTAAIDYYSRCDHMWTGEYGKARKRFLAYLIEATKKFVEA